MVEEKMRFFPTFPEVFPKKENVFGKAREFIEELEEAIKFHGIYESLGTKPNKTYLLTGSPGTGKTMSTRAINNSLNEELLYELMNCPVKTKDDGTKIKDLTTNKMRIAMFEYDIGRYGTAYINMGSRYVQQYFDTMFFCSNSGIPVIGVLDEADALIGSRKNLIQSHSEDRKVLETIMKNMQTAHDIPNVYVVLMSNLPEDCDEAMLRAGRIDKRINFGLPNKSERKIAFQKVINQINEKVGYQVIRCYNLDSLVDLSKDFNYADIKQSITAALKSKAREMIKDKKPGIKITGYIKQNRLEKSVKEHSQDFQKKQTRRIGFT